LLLDEITEVNEINEMNKRNSPAMETKSKIIEFSDGALKSDS